MAATKRPSPGPSRVIMVFETRTIDASEWDGAVARLGGLFFHRYTWLSIMAGTFGARFDPMAMLDSDKIVGVVPEITKMRGPLHTINWLPLPYLGPLVPDDELASALALLAARYRHPQSLRVVQAMPRCAPAESQMRGFERHEEHTVVVAVDAHDEELLTAMEKRGRRAIAAAQRRGVVIEPAREADVCELLPAWCEAALARQGHPPAYPRETYAAIWGAFRSDPDVRFAAARFDGRTVGVQVDCAGGRRAVVWEGASSDEGKHLGANPLLDWDALRWARSRGADELDLVGAPTPGLTKYKRQFGGIVEPFTVYQRLSPLYKALRSLPGMH